MADESEDSSTPPGTAKYKEWLTYGILAALSLYLMYSWYSAEGGPITAGLLGEYVGRLTPLILGAIIARWLFTRKAEPEHVEEAG